MPSKLYELKPYKGQLADAEATNDLLRRHLIAVAIRDGAHRRDAHLYHLAVHETHNGRPERQPLTTFSVPVDA